MLGFNKPPVSLLRIENERIGSKVVRGYVREISFDDFSKDMVLAGSINGIVCLSNGNEFFGRFVALWNPAVKCAELIKLRGLRTSYDKWESMSVGFGYDQVAGDYKIILIIPVVIPPEFEERRWSRVEIYSVKRGYWRNVEGGQGISLPFWPMFVNCTFIVNGVPYWVGFHEGPDDMVGSEPEEILGAFDPRTEVYKKISYPVLVRNEGTCVHPVNYKDSVAALVLFPGQCPNSMVDLYVLDENSSDWTKIYTIGPFSFKNMSIPQCFSTGELVVNTWVKDGMDDWDQNSYYCDPKTNCVFPACGFDSSIPLWSQSYSYVESLQLTGNGDENKKVQHRKKTWTMSLPDDFKAVLHL